MMLSGGWYNDGFPVDQLTLVFQQYLHGYYLQLYLFTKFEDEGSLAVLSLLWFVFSVNLKNDSIGSDMI